MATRTKARPRGTPKAKARSKKGPASFKKAAVSTKARKPSKASAPKSSVAAASTEPLQRSLTHLKMFFDRTLSAFDEADAGFAPAPGMFTTAQQVAHAAQTFDWFLEGAFRPDGFTTDFPAMERQVREVDTLARAKAWLEQAHARVLSALKERSAADWAKPIARDTIMGGAPRSSIIDGLADHTAHHRGSLAVYARLRGKVPPVPYA
jgi:uncharacterized damage-inducible protein DinB